MQDLYDELMNRIIEDKKETDLTLIEHLILKYQEIKRQKQFEASFGQISTDSNVLALKTPSQVLLYPDVKSKTQQFAPISILNRLTSINDPSQGDMSPGGNWGMGFKGNIPRELRQSLNDADIKSKAKRNVTIEI